MNRRMITAAVAVMMLCSMAGVCTGDEIIQPEVTVKDFYIPQNEALQFVTEMKTGWCLGNTFDAIDCVWLSDPMDYEKGWSGEKTTEEMIQAVQNAGFQSIRIPVSWHNHLDKDWRINEEWLNRVQEVVDWAYTRNMYVILNIHHDCDPNYYYPDRAHLENSSAYMRMIWNQLSVRFENYGDHLLFEGINEPRMKDTEYEWRWDAEAPECREAMQCICELNQVFVDTVRAAGGRNAERFLMVPAYDASAICACDPAFTLPEDRAVNRLIVSVHAYTPYSFALDYPGTASFSLESNEQKSEIGMFQNDLYTRYISQGIPVLIGEYGARNKNGNLQDRVNFTAFYVAQARSRGMTCIWWDNNAFSGNGENFGLLNRGTSTWVYPEIVEAIMQNCSKP